MLYTAPPGTGQACLRAIEAVFRNPPGPIIGSLPMEIVREDAGSGGVEVVARRSWTAVAPHVVSPTQLWVELLRPVATGSSRDHHGNTIAARHAASLCWPIGGSRLTDLPAPSSTAWVTTHVGGTRATNASVLAGGVAMRVMIGIPLVMTGPDHSLALAVPSPATPAQLPVAARAWYAGVQGPVLSPTVIPHPWTSCLEAYVDSLSSCRRVWAQAGVELNWEIHRRNDTGEHPLPAWTADNDPHHLPAGMVMLGEPVHANGNNAGSTDRGPHGAPPGNAEIGCAVESRSVVNMSVRQAQSVQNLLTYTQSRAAVVVATGTANCMWWNARTISSRFNRQVVVVRSASDMRGHSLGMEPPHRLAMELVALWRFQAMTNNRTNRHFTSPWSFQPSGSPTEVHTTGEEARQRVAGAETGDPGTIVRMGVVLLASLVTGCVAGLLVRARRSRLAAHHFKTMHDAGLSSISIGLQTVLGLDRTMSHRPREYLVDEQKARYPRRRTSVGSDGYTHDQQADFSGLM